MEQTQNDNLVEIKGMTFARGEQLIFDEANIEIRRGKITAVMGPSGSGKTTLLQLISAQLYPQQGEVLVDGINIHTLRRKRLYDARKKMGLLFQSGALFTNLSVYENVAFPLRENTNLPDAMIHDLVLIQLEAVGLRGARDLMPSELSGGMSRRVALARSLILSPKLMMYDEPFTGQDPITMGVLVNLIKRVNYILGLTSVIVSHDVAETFSIADYVYIIVKGKIVGQGTAEEVMADTNPWVNQFVKGEHDGAIPFNYPACKYEEDLDI